MDDDVDGNSIHWFSREELQEIPWSSWENQPSHIMKGQWRWCWNTDFGLAKKTWAEMCNAKKHRHSSIKQKQLVQPTYQGLHKKGPLPPGRLLCIELLFHLFLKCKEIKRKTNPSLWSAKKNMRMSTNRGGNSTFGARRHNSFGTFNKPWLASPSSTKSCISFSTAAEVTCSNP